MKKTDIYTMTAAAKELGVTRQAVYYWIKKNWVTPKRDYRNYPVFTAGDLTVLKKWQHTLTKGTDPVTPRQKIRPRVENTPSISSYTWDEIQKIFYR